MSLYVVLCGLCTTYVVLCGLCTTYVVLCLCMWYYVVSVPHTETQYIWLQRRNQIYIWHIWFHSTAECVRQRPSQRPIVLCICLCVYMSMTHTLYVYVYICVYVYVWNIYDTHSWVSQSLCDLVICLSHRSRGGGLGSSTIFKNLMSPTPRRKWYLTTGRRTH